MSSKIVCSKVQIDLGQFVESAIEHIGEHRASLEILDLLVDRRGIWDVIDALAEVALIKAASDDEIAAKCNTVAEAQMRVESATELRDLAGKLQELCQ